MDDVEEKKTEPPPEPEPNKEPVVQRDPKPERPPPSRRRGRKPLDMTVIIGRQPADALRYTAVLIE